MDSKQKNIVAMFDAIAPKYDRANRILSAGIDISWRKEACKKTLSLLSSKKQLCILDVACGTGDMILHWNHFSKHENKEVDFVALDPSSKMLELAKEKLNKENIKAKFISAHAQDLDFDSNRADIVSIAYGLRNVVELDKALGEFYRVLKSGGVLVILEFTKNDNPNILDKIAHFYTNKILPLIGGLISRNYAAYKYLPDSINTFQTLKSLSQKLETIGFKIEVAKTYSANISSLLIATKI